MNKFIFIAVNYNGSEYTMNYINSVNSIELSESDEVKIIIVDNKSGSNDLEKLGKFCNSIENVNLIKSDLNLGYFKGLNYGIKSAIKDDNTILIVGNNDLTFDKKFIVNLKNIKFNENILVIAPNIITRDGRQQNPHVVDKVPEKEKLKAKIYFSNYYIGQGLRLANQFLKRFSTKQPVLKNDYSQMIIKRGIGACYVLTPFFTHKFEKLDDRVFMWGEEALLSNQVESVGGKTLYDPSIIIHHYESASVISIQSKKKYYIVRESYKIYSKYL